VKASSGLNGKWGQLGWRIKVAWMEVGTAKAVVMPSKPSLQWKMKSNFCEGGGERYRLPRLKVKANSFDIEDGEC
jgi:hypothetical protein